MTGMSRSPALLLGALLAAAPLWSQRPDPPRTVSPEVHPDRTITFRLRAPDAPNATLDASWAGGETVMKKGADGVWSTTVGPVEPGIYSYTYEVAGVRLIDPHNPEIKLWLGGHSSLVTVPDDGPAFYELTAVDHGDLHAHYYESSVVARTRHALVYTPPGYHESDESYPTLYLLHGSGDNERAWVDVGRANLIFDNLIAAGEMAPMVVVMPNGHPIPWADRSRDRDANTKLFRQDLVGDLLPLVEDRYRVKRERQSRAVVGLSMGGGQALNTGLGRLDLFAWVGAFSAATPDPAEDLMTQALFEDPEHANEEIELLWIAVGEGDFLLDRNQTYHAALEEAGIEHQYQVTDGDHSWPVWRRYLHELAPQLFE